MDVEVREVRGCAREVRGIAGGVTVAFCCGSMDGQVGKDSA